MLSGYGSAKDVVITINSRTIITWIHRLLCAIGISTLRLHLLTREQEDALGQTGECFGILDIDQNL